MRLGKIFGAIGAGILGAGAIVLAGRTGVGKPEEGNADDTEKAADNNGDVLCETPAEEIAAEEIPVEAPSEEE